MYINGSMKLVTAHMSRIPLTPTFQNTCKGSIRTLRASRLCHSLEHDGRCCTSVAAFFDAMCFLIAHTLERHTLQKVVQIETAELEGVEGVSITPFYHYICQCGNVLAPFLVTFVVKALARCSRRQRPRSWNDGFIVSRRCLYQERGRIFELGFLERLTRSF